MNRILSEKKTKQLAYLHSLPRAREWRERQSIRMRGRRFSDEHKKRISERHKGMKKPWVSYYNRLLGKTKRMNDSLRGKPQSWNRGSKNPNWKGGISPLAALIRNSFKYRQWRSDIFTRDNFTCVLCGKNKCWVEVDHYPESFSKIFQESGVKTLEEALNYEKFWNINGGRTLCKNCHASTDSYKNRLQ